MNLFMLTVLDEKEGYVRLKKNELMEALRVVYENGFQDGKYTAETRKEIEPGKICFIGGDDPCQT